MDFAQPADIPGGGYHFASAILNHSPIPIVLFDQDTSIVYVNPAMEKHTGFSSEELIGTRAPYPWWTEDMLERFLSSLEKVKRRGADPEMAERLFHRKNGERFWVQINTSLIRLTPRRMSYLAMWIDISERKMIEDKLRESEGTARALLDAFTDLAILVDLNGKILAINRAGAYRLGKTMEELVGLDIVDFIPRSVAESRKARFAKAIRTGRPVHFEDEATGRVFDNSLHPVFDGKGKVSRLAVFARDVTQRRLMRDKVRATLKELTIAIPSLIPLTQPYPISTLTPRERTIAQLLSDGKSTKEVAGELRLSIKTVETHRSRIIQKLGVRNIVELTKLAVREGLTSP